MSTPTPVRSSSRLASASCCASSRTDWPNPANVDAFIASACALNNTGTDGGVHSSFQACMPAVDGGSIAGTRYLGAKGGSTEAAERFAVACAGSCFNGRSSLPSPFAALPRPLAVPGAAVTSTAATAGSGLAEASSPPGSTPPGMSGHRTCNSCSSAHKARLSCSSTDCSM